MKNYFIVNIDGLDVSGKETFAKQLKSVFMEINGISGKIKVYLHSFPTYDSEIGQKIYTELRKDPFERDQNYLNSLFMSDRANMMSKYIKLFEDDTEYFHILILDRYYISNLLYSLPVSISNIEDLSNNIDISKIEETDSYKQFLNEHNSLPNPDLLIMFYEKTERGRAKHLELISLKSSKDSNETAEFQSKVNAAVKCVMELPVIKKINSFTIDIGENFHDYMIIYNIIAYILRRVIIR